MFYGHQPTSIGNSVVTYEDIMLNYGEHPLSFTPYVNAETNYEFAKNTLQLSSDLADYTSQTTNQTGLYRAVYNTNITDAGDGVLPHAPDYLADVTVNGMQLVTVVDTVNNIIGLGVSSTGQISIYYDGTGRNGLVEYIANNPVSVTYRINDYVMLDNVNFTITDGCIIEADNSVTLSYYKEKSKNIKVVCFGDSITGMYENGTDYPSILGRENDYTVYNVGFSGCRYTDHASANYIPFSMNRLADAVYTNNFTEQDAKAPSISTIYEKRLATLKSIDFNSVDYVSIFYGTNDWASNTILKSTDDISLENKQRTNVEDALKYSIEKILTKYPHLKIIVLCPFWRSKSAGEDSNINPNSNGIYLYEFSDYIQDIAKKNYNLKTINLYWDSGVNAITNRHYTADGTHPTLPMSESIARLIAKSIV